MATDDVGRFLSSSTGRRSNDGSVSTSTSTVHVGISIFTTGVGKTAGAAIEDVELLVCDVCLHDFGFTLSSFVSKSRVVGCVSLSTVVVDRSEDRISVCITDVGI